MTTRPIDQNERISSWLVVTTIAFILGTTLFSGCAKKSEPAPAPVSVASPKQKSPFEQDLDYVRSGQFSYVFVFSRVDGAIISSDDVTYLKANSPQETNQWIRTDGGRRIIAGTNFEFKPEQIDALSKRFKIENLSGQ